MRLASTPGSRLTAVSALPTLLRCAAVQPAVPDCAAQALLPVVVTHTSLVQIVAAGANALVAGSAVFKAKDGMAAGEGSSS